MAEPAVSIICPAYNRGELIRDTLESVRRQSETDWELIVVSDGSEDDTDAVVQSVADQDSRVRLLRTPHYGHPSGPCNVAGRAARSLLRAYISHDDQWQPHHLGTLRRALTDEVDVVYSRGRRVAPDGTELAVTEQLSQMWHPTIQAVNPLFEPGRAMWRAAAVAEVGGWTEVADGLEDWDLWHRLASAGKSFVPLGDVTIDMLESPVTRKHSLSCPHRIELARVGSAAQARRAVRALGDRRRVASFLEAYREDVVDWYLDLLAAGELRYPAGWMVGEDMIRSAIEEVVGAETRVWESLTITAVDGGDWSVGSVVATQTTEHARHIGALTTQRMPKLSALIRSVVDAGPPAARADRTAVATR